jgi:hypothetical protein
MTPVAGVTMKSLPRKTALLGLDNAYISFDNFEVSHFALLNRFSSIVEHTGEYKLHLPKGVTRMVDLLISRLLTGRIVLSEFTSNYAIALYRHSYKFATNRTLWKGKSAIGKKVSELPLFNAAFINYSRSLKIIDFFIASSRDRVVECIKNDKFTNNVVEATCISKFVGTSFAVDSTSVLRKLLGSQALFQESFLGESSFVCNATCAAEGDNTIMELKIVQDMFRGRTSLMPFKLLLRSVWSSSYGRYVAWQYLCKIMYAMLIREKALNDGQLLKDIAWCRAHLLIIDTWITSGKPIEWLESYSDILIRFPVPIQC